MYKNHAFTLTGQINWQDTKTYCNEVQKKKNILHTGPRSAR